MTPEQLAEIEARAEAATRGPWEDCGPHQKGKDGHFSPPKWTYVEHNFPDYPYEGQLEEEYGIYPPLGEAGPVALVAGRDNAAFFAAVRTDIPILIAEIKRLQTLVKSLQCELKPDDFNLPGAFVGRR